MTIADQLNDIIDILSEKLGVAADYVYQALLKQANVVLIRNIFWVVLFSLIIVFTLVYVKRVYLKKDKAGKTKYEYAEYETLGYIYFAFTWIFAVISLIVVICIPFLINTIIQIVGNPEYWVLNRIMEML